MASTYSTTSMAGSALVCPSTGAQRRRKKKTENSAHVGSTYAVFVLHLATNQVQHANKKKQIVLSVTSPSKPVGRWDWCCVGKKMFGELDSEDSYARWWHFISSICSNGRTFCLPDRQISQFPMIETTSFGHEF